MVTKSVVFRTSKNFVRRIEHEDLTQPYASNDESLDNTLKVSNALIVSIFAALSAIFKGVNLLRTVLNVLCITSG